MDLRGMLGLGDPHPLHSTEAARDQIDLLPADDPLHALGEIAQWLRSVGASKEFKPRTRLEVVALLDDAGRKPERELMQRFVSDPRLRNPRGKLAWTAVYEFWSALADSLQYCALEEVPDRPAGEAARMPFAAIAARALRARVGQIRVAMLHYEPVPTKAWAGLYALHVRCEHAALMTAATHAYEKERMHTTPLLELMNGLLVAIAAPERLPPEEIDAAFRIAQRFAGAGRLEAAPFEGATHVIDLAGGSPPVPLAARAAGSSRNPQIRYLGAKEAVDKLEHMLSHHELSMLDEDVRIAREYSPGQKITVLRQFMAYWGPHPPHAERKLLRLEGGMSVAHGFQTICHHIPHVVTRAEESKRGKKGGARLEVTEDQVLEPPETWPERDAGLRVVHALAGPGAGAWAEVGDLAAIRIHDRSDWWLAVIRRLSLDEHGTMQAEFEVVSRKPFGAWARVMGRKDRMTAVWESASGAFAFDYLQAILLTDRAAPGKLAPMLIPKGKFVPEQIVELLDGERSRLLKLTEFREQGKDFDWCATEPVANMQ
jgi:hypothetical protein